MRKLKKALASLAIAGMVLSMAPASIFAADSNRIEGKDRYETAIKIAEKAYSEATTAVVAAGNPNNLVDALAVAPLAAQEKAPIYLTNIADKVDVEKGLLDSLKKLGVEKVLAVGAAGKDKATVDALEKAGYEVEVLAGEGRIQTAEAINAKLVDPKGTIVVGLQGEADAMSVATFAAVNKYQIVIAKGDGTTDAKDVDYIVGGEARVKNIDGATRLSGNNRYETNKDVVSKLDFNYNTVYVANGQNLADALAASVLAAQTNSPILLANDRDNSVEAASVVNEKLTADSKVIALGGTAAVSNTALNKVAYKAPAAIVVESVSAINGGEIVVGFNKAVKKDSVIETSGGGKDTVVDNVFKLNGVPLTANKATLSSDGKTLTIFADSQTAFDGAYTFEVVGDLVKATTGEFAPRYVTSFTVDDKVRPAVVQVDTVSKYVFDIKLSEPVKATGTITAKYASDNSSVTIDSSPIAGNDKKITVTLNSATTANKEIVISIPQLTDYKGNVAVPTTVNVTVSDADKTKPTVASAVATSNTEVKLTFSEKLASVDATKVKYNGTSVGTGNAVLDGKDKTVVKVTVPSTTTSAGISLDADAVFDLSGNGNNAWSQIVNFALDKSGPVINSFSVVKKSNVNYLKLQFNEKVAAPGGGFANLTLKYVDDYGVTQTVTVPAGNVVVDSDDATIVEIKLQDGSSNDLKANAVFTVKFVKGYFIDLFSNESVEREISFTNAGTGEVAKLKLIAVNPITNGVDLDGAYINVSFTEPVDPASATNKANYVVENATVSKVELTANSAAGATVKVYLTDDSVKATGYYNVTVSGVKGYHSNIAQMDSTTRNILINENVRATVKSKTVTFDGTNTYVEVVFTETVKEVGSTQTNDYTLYVDGKAVSSATVTGNQTTTPNNTITFTINVDLSQDIADGKVVKLVAKSTLDIVDQIGNKIKTDDIVLN